MKVWKLLASSTLAFGLSHMAQASTWAEADALFAQRQNNRTAIQAARSAYSELAATARGPELVRAVAQLGRLAAYEGEMLLAKNDTQGRREIFGNCWCKKTSGMSCAEPGFIEKIDPKLVGATPEYYYFKGMCMAYWGEVANLIEQITWVPRLVDIVAEGRKLDMRFEGSGIDRLEAGLRANVKTRPLPGGMFNPQLAVQRAEEALDRPAYPGDPNSGDQYYDNWGIYALALAANNQKDEARAILDEKIQELQDRVDGNDLPRGREPETRWMLKVMQQRRDELGD